LELFVVKGADSLNSIPTKDLLHNEVAEPATRADSLILSASSGAVRPQ